MIKPMERKRLTEAVELLNFEMGIILTGNRQSGTEDKLKDVLMREVNASVRAREMCFKRAETMPSGPIFVVILVMRRSSNASSSEKRATAGSLPCENDWSRSRRMDESLIDAINNHSTFHVSFSSRIVIGCCNRNTTLISHYEIFRGERSSS